MIFKQAIAVATIVESPCIGGVQFDGSGVIDDSSIAIVHCSISVASVHIDPRTARVVLNCRGISIQNNRIVNHGSLSIAQCCIAVSSQGTGI